MKEFAIILRIAPYVGENTWLSCGGEQLKEEVSNALIEADESKIMYAIITVRGKVVTSDFGYASADEAKRTLGVSNPGMTVLVG